MIEDKNKSGGEDVSDVLDDSVDTKGQFEDIEDDLTGERRDGDDRRQFAYLEGINERCGYDRRDENNPEEDDADDEL